ncbi:MAG: UDP-N-acetylmuramyl-tripeptide synthetase, partial [bacterium]
MNIKKLIPTSLKNFYHHYQASSAVKRYGFPSRRLKVIGITGTDGKTTTTTFLTSVLRVAGFETGMISTIRAEIGGRELDTGLHVTTPDAADVQRYLSMMVEEKMEYAVLEVTSHGLRQGRVFGVDFDVAVVTNITPEHLDQHGTFEQYREDKGKLFSVLASSFRKPGVPKVAVVNRDDIGSFEYLSKFFSDRQIVYGCVDEAEVWASDIVDSQRGVGFVLHSGKDEVAVYLKIPGHYNVSNALAVASVALSQGIDLPTIKVGLEAVEQVSGRMEYVTKVGDPFTVIVDFAHTPNSLEQALKSLRSKLETENKVNGKQGKLLVLFGCAGERDPY